MLWHCDPNNLCFTRVRASGVLDPAKVPLHSHAHRVVSVGQLEAGGVVVVEAEHGAADSREVLQTSVRGCEQETVWAAIVFSVTRREVHEVVGIFLQ